LTNLYVAEKASVGKALANVLPGAKKREGNFIRCGDDIVAWASGHLLELCEPEDYDPAYKKWSRETLLYVPDKWKLKEKERTKTLFSGLRKLIHGLAPSDTAVNVGDGDREGQTLIDEILEHCGWNGRTKRLRLNDVNPDAIRKALSNMKDNAEYRGEYRAGQARMYADWLCGLPMTRFVTVSLREAGYKVSALSVGRVQTPTLGLVVEREREIREFVPSPYFDLRASLTLCDGRVITGLWVPGEKHASIFDGRKRIIDRGAAAALAASLGGKSGEITSVTKQARKSSPPLPYSLPKLQMAASARYGVTDTLVHLQKLYEAGYVTYPRSECGYIPEGHFAEAGRITGAIRSGCPSLSDMLGGADLSRKSPAWDDGKITEHHAVIPTAKAPPDGALTETERKIYGLVCARYVLQFLGDCEYEETAAEFEVNGEIFRASGRTVINLGWQGWDKRDETGGHGKEPHGEEAEEKDGDGKRENQVLPQVHQGESGAVRASAEEHVTRPPEPYTYHALIGAMNSIHTFVKDPDIRRKLKEVHGIGTPATQEAVISTLFARGYIEKHKKIIRPTDLGRLLIHILSEGKAEVMTRPDLTALWEQKMSDIESGGVSLESFVAEVAGMVGEILSGSLNVPPDIPYIERRKEPDGEITEAPCPMGCGKNARRFSGKYGFFWKCSCSPGVTFKDSGGVPAAREARVEIPCPASGCKGKAIRFVSEKDGRPFWKCGACGNFFGDESGKPVSRREKSKK
jgi:DNA topoisomerase-3